MNRNLVIVMAGGFLIAVLVALMVQILLSGDQSEQPVVVKEEPKVQIIVAAKKLPVGVKLGEKDVKWQAWPEGAVFDGALVRKENDKIPKELLQGTLKREIADGQPVTLADVVNKDEKSVMSALLSEGMRAVSIDVDAASMVAGFIGPGDHVDVILTYKMSIDYEGEDSPDIENTINQTISRSASETVLQNIKVLAVDQAPAREKDGAKLGRTVTLEVDMRGAEVLALGSEMGEMRLALRRMGDDTVAKRDYDWVSDTLVTSAYEEVMKRLKRMDAVGAPAYEMPAHFNTGQKNDFVRVYRGEKVQSLPSH